jgi:hypothetical protein
MTWRWLKSCLIADGVMPIRKDTLRFHAAPAQGRSSESSPQKLLMGTDWRFLNGSEGAQGVKAALRVRRRRGWEEKRKCMNE